MRRSIAWSMVARGAAFIRRGFGAWASLAACLAGSVAGQDVTGTVWQPYRAPAADAEGVARTAATWSVESLADPPAVAAVDEVWDPTVPTAADPGWQVPYPLDFGPLPARGALAPDDPLLWQWRVLPAGVVYPSYMAGVKESRLGAQSFDAEGVWLMDVTLGGRAALVRYGIDDPRNPQGWELAVEGAAFPRLNFDENWDVEAVDFRFGVPLTYGRDNWKLKFSYYHLSAHMGDELAIRENLLSQRINYARDALVLGVSYYPLPAWRWYAETAWAFYYDDGALPWEFQFGIDVAQPGPTGARGTPFAAFNGHLREDVDFGGNFVAQAGWLWRGESTSTLRLGLHYFNGKTNQFEFFDKFEQQVGGGLWYDF